MNHQLNSSLGIIILDEHGHFKHTNEVAQHFLYYFETFKSHFQENIQHYCLLECLCEITNLSINDGIIFIQPLSNVVLLERENKKSAEVYNELYEVINSSFDGIVISDNKGLILHQNPAYGDITGLHPSECIGRNLTELEELGVIDHSATLQALYKNDSVTINQSINTGKNVLVSAVPIRDKTGDIKKVVNNVRDLTQLNQLETEIQTLEETNQKITEELKSLKEQLNPKLSLISSSAKMKEVIERALKIAQIDSGVIIQGESGVGKEKIVNLIHMHSLRKKKPLIKINCGAIPENLLESELFGYVSGSFTGASKQGKIGLIEAANDGILFLDEIGEMPLDLQVKILRVLEEREITPVGGTTPRTVNVRIIAATNRDLNAMVQAGEFRKDLFYRLNIIPIIIPPLRERKEDVIPLTYHFLKELNEQYGLNKQISSEVLERLRRYDWPGNVRELQNMVERIVLMSEDNVLKSAHIDKEFSNDRVNDRVETMIPEANVPLKQYLASIEIHFLKERIKEHPSLRSAARSLDIDQSTLVRKMKRYNLRVEDIK